MSLSFNHLGANFMQSLEVANYAQSTIRNYRRYLTKFINYLADSEVKLPEEITKEILQDYQIFLAQETNKEGRNNCVAAQNLSLKPVLYFCRFLVENDLINKDPGRSIRYAKEPKNLPRDILSTLEVKKILDQPDIQIPMGFRDRTILELFYSSAIRKDELRKLDLPDLNYHDGTLMVREGKGKKDRYVPVGQIACKFLESYIQHIRPVFLRDDEPNQALFLSKKGNRISKSALDETIRKYAKAAKLKKKVSCHTFRHTCATHLVNNGMNIRHVQALLGHASLSSTQVYTRVAIKDLKRVIRKHHPREKGIG